MMIWNWLVSLFLFPIRWFWLKYQECKETENLKRMIFLFIVSISGLLVFGIIFLILASYLLTNHMPLLIGVGAVLWLYAYAKDKYITKQPSEIPSVGINDQQLLEQAEKGYPVMRNILYQTTKNVAPDIGGNIPRLLPEIEMPEEHYILSNNICFYQFRLVKADMRIQYTANDLSEFKTVFQSAITMKIQSGAFPSLQMENYRDRYGNWHDSVIIDTIEDVGNMFIIQTVFASPEYAEYAHQKQLIHQSTDNDSRRFETSWNEKQ